jgi:hypothetical protein
MRIHGDMYMDTWSHACTYKALHACGYMARRTWVHGTCMWIHCHMHVDSCPLLFFIISTLLVPWFLPLIIFENKFHIRWDIWIARSFRVLSKYRERNFFANIEQNNQLFLVGHWSSLKCTYCFLKYSVNLKNCEENIFFSGYSKLFGHICCIHGMNLFKYWDYVNESVRICRIGGMR